MSEPREDPYVVLGLPDKNSDPDPSEVDISKAFKAKVKEKPPSGVNESEWKQRFISAKQTLTQPGWTREWFNTHRFGWRYRTISAPPGAQNIPGRESLQRFDEHCLNAYGPTPIGDDGQYDEKQQRWWLYTEADILAYDQPFAVDLYVVDDRSDPRNVTRYTIDANIQFKYILPRTLFDVYAAETIVQSGHHDALVADHSIERLCSNRKLLLLDRKISIRRLAENFQPHFARLIEHLGGTIVSSLDEEHQTADILILSRQCVNPGDPYPDVGMNCHVVTPDWLRKTFIESKTAPFDEYGFLFFNYRKPIAALGISVEQIREWKFVGANMVTCSEVAANADLFTDLEYAVVSYEDGTGGGGGNWFEESPAMGTKLLTNKNLKAIKADQFQSYITQMKADMAAQQHPLSYYKKQHSVDLVSFYVSMTAKHMEGLERKSRDTEREKSTLHTACSEVKEKLQKSEQSFSHSLSAQEKEVAALKAQLAAKEKEATDRIAELQRQLTEAAAATSSAASAILLRPPNSLPIFTEPLSSPVVSKAAQSSSSFQSPPPSASSSSEAPSHSQPPQPATTLNNGSSSVTTVAGDKRGRKRAAPSSSDNHPSLQTTGILQPAAENTQHPNKKKKMRHLPRNNAALSTGVKRETVKRESEKEEDDDDDDAVGMISGGGEIPCLICEFNQAARKNTKDPPLHGTNVRCPGNLSVSFIEEISCDGCGKKWVRYNKAGVAKYGKGASRLNRLLKNSRNKCRQTHSSASSVSSAAATHG